MLTFWYSLILLKQKISKSYLNTEISEKVILNLFVLFVILNLIFYYYIFEMICIWWL